MYHLCGQYWEYYDQEDLPMNKKTVYKSTNKPFCIIIINKIYNNSIFTSLYPKYSDMLWEANTTIPLYVVVSKKPLSRLKAVCTDDGENPDDGAVGAGLTSRNTVKVFTG